MSTLSAYQPACTPDFWRGKRVLVTGHTGFKGGWLSLWLQHLGANVSGFSLAPPTTPNFFELAHVGDGMDSCLGDIRNPADISAALARYQPEIVFHLAAQSLVRYGYDHPSETYATNVMGLVNLLEGLRQTPSVRAVVNITTDKCYANLEQKQGYVETQALGGDDPYSSSKACSELVTAAWRKAYFASTATHRAPGQTLQIATARAGNVIGGGDWGLDRLIPDLLTALSESRPVILRNPGAIRPWQYVLEPLSGYLRLAEKLAQEGAPWAEAWNFGPAESDAQPVQALVEALIRHWGGGTWSLDNAPQPHETHTLKLDCHKAQERLGWQPRWNLDTTLARIVEWHRAFLNQNDLRQLSIDQINSFSQI